MADDPRDAYVRELKAEIDRLRAQNDKLIDALTRHPDPAPVTPYAAPAPWTWTWTTPQDAYPYKVTF